MYFLGIETATDACSIVLYHNTNLIAIEYTDQPKAHSQYLTSFIQNVLQNAHLSISQLDGIVLSSGPGSYTGLRIGMSTAKGIAYALDIPIMLMPSTMVAAYSGLSYVSQKDAILIGIVDAPNKEIYLQTFTLKQQYLLPHTEPIHRIVEDNIFTSLNINTSQSIYLSGKGASKIKALFPDNSNIHLIEQAKQDMQNIGQWIIHAYQNKNFCDIELSEPLYVKDFTPTLKPKKQGKT